MPKSRILVIDDEAAIRDSLRMTLEYEGYEFLGAARPTAAMICFSPLLSPII